MTGRDGAGMGRDGQGWDRDHWEEAAASIPVVVGYKGAESGAKREMPRLGALSEGRTQSPEPRAQNMEPGFEAGLRRERRQSCLSVGARLGLA